jgi:hypothetical protein
MNETRKWTYLPGFQHLATPRKSEVGPVGALGCIEPHTTHRGPAQGDSSNYRGAGALEATTQPPHQPYDSPEAELLGGTPLQIPALRSVALRTGPFRRFP